MPVTTRLLPPCKIVIFSVFGTFSEIAFSTEQLKIIKLVFPALGEWDDVINVHDHPGSLCADAAHLALVVSPASDLTFHPSGKWRPRGWD